MSKVSVFRGFELDFASPTSTTDYNPVGLPTVTPTLISWGSSASRFEWSGSNLSVNYAKQTVTGTITGVKYYEGSTLKLDASGISMPAHTLVTAVLTDTDPNFDTFFKHLSSSVFAKADTMTGHTANDTIYGYGGNDRISGGSGNDFLRGDAGDDILKGDAGKDSLQGSAGADDLYGGSGADKFVFRAASESTVSSAGRDTIFDFSRSEGDHIDFSKFDANTNKSGTQDFSFVGTKSFSGKSGELRYEIKSGDTYVYGDTNGDKKADFAIHLDDAVKFTAGDFLF